MKNLMKYILFSIFVFRGSFGLKCYFGFYPNLTTFTCPSSMSNFCAIVQYKSGSFNVDCEEEICKEFACTNYEYCKEPGISYKDELDGMKFEINCCEKDLCNVENIESSAQSIIKINFLFLFLLFSFTFQLN